jgi:peptidoglycan hydrolase CwlO-like protein
MRHHGLKPVRAIAAASLVLGALIGPGALVASRAAPTQSELEAARARLDELRQEYENVSEEFRATRAELESIKMRMNATELTVRKLARGMINQQEHAVQLARELYKGGSAGDLEAVLSQKSLADIDAQLAYIESSQKTHSEFFEKLAADRADLELKLDELDEARAGAAAAEQRLADLRSDVEASMEAQRDEIAEIEAAIAEAERRREAREAAAAVAATEAAAAEAEEVAQQEIEPVASPPAPSGPYSANWDAIAQCESGGNWHIDSTYDGGLQFHPDTWLGYGGGRYARYAYQASREQQIAIAERVLADQGPSAWPNCFVAA